MTTRHTYFPSPEGYNFNISRKVVNIFCIATNDENEWNKINTNIEQVAIVYKKNCLFKKSSDEDIVGNFVVFAFKDECLGCEGRLFQHKKVIKQKHSYSADVEEYGDACDLLLKELETYEEPDNYSIAICGSRSIDSNSLVFRRARWAIESELKKHPNATINIGDANGVDHKVQQMLTNMNLKFVVWHPEGEIRYQVDKDCETVAVPWKTRKYTTRDRAMLDASDKLIAVWDEKSPGTKQNIVYIGAENTIILRDGINISSKSSGIGGALSLRADKAKLAGLISKDYPVTVNYENLSENYQQETGEFVSLFQLFRNMEVVQNVVDIEDEMRDGKVKEICIIWLIYCFKSKFQSSPSLYYAVRERGGYDWLNTCTYTVSDKDFAEIEDSLGLNPGEVSSSEFEQVNNDHRFAEIMDGCMNYKYLSGTGPIESLYIHCLAEAYQEVQL